jgi:hypothetical protein
LYSVHLVVVDRCGAEISLVQRPRLTSWPADRSVMLLSMERLSIRFKCHP